MQACARVTWASVEIPGFQDEERERLPPEPPLTIPFQCQLLSRHQTALVRSGGVGVGREKCHRERRGVCLRWDLRALFGNVSFPCESWHFQSLLPETPKTLGPAHSF